MTVKHPDPLEFLSDRLREMLRRLANRDRRTEKEELAYLIEARANGRLRDHGDDATATIPLSDLPQSPVTQVFVERVRVEDSHTGSELPPSST